MTAEYVRSFYGVAYKRGDRLRVDGRLGTLVSFPGQYLGVRFDGEKHTERCHPKWRVELAEGGAVQWGYANGGRTAKSHGFISDVSLCGQFARDTVVVLAPDRADDNRHGIACSRCFEVAKKLRGES